MISLLEASLNAFLRPASTFELAASRPAPSLPALILNLLLFVGASMTVNFLHAALAYPQAVTRYGAANFLLVGVIALALVVPLSLAAAAGLHLLARLAGGGGEFRRSYQLVSMLSPLACLHALIAWLPEAWPLPALLGTVLAAVGLARLHQARAAALWTMLAVAGTGTLAAQWLVRSVLERSARYAALPEGPASEQEPVSPLDPEAPGGRPPDEMQEGPGASLGSLPYVRPPLEPGAGVLSNGASLGGPAGPAGAGLERMGAGDRAGAQQGMAAMLESMTPMFSDPALLKGMSPKEARQMRELASLMSQAQKHLKDGTTMTPREKAEMLKKMQSLSRHLGDSAARFAAQHGTAKTGAGATKKRATKTPDEEDNGR